MSKITKHACEACGKETLDYYAEVGWINVEPLAAIRVSLGRNAERRAESTTFYQRKGEADFCSLQCFVDFIKAEVKKEQARISKAESKLGKVTQDTHLLKG